MNRPVTSLPAVRELLLEGTADEQQRWTEAAAVAFSSDFLRALEQRLIANVEARYTKDPGSLLNLRYHYDRPREIERIHHAFDEVYQCQLDRLQTFVETVEEAELAHLVGLQHDRHFLARRKVRQLRHADAIAERIDTALARDTELQSSLVRQHLSHQQKIELLELEAELARKRDKFTAKVDRARRLLEQPHELNLKLHDLLLSLLKYQQSLNDRAMRNPALADRLRMMGVGLSAVMTSVDQIIKQLNSVGDGDVDPERLRQQNDELLSMAMEQLQQWQHETRSETDL